MSAEPLPASKKTPSVEDLLQPKRVRPKKRRRWLRWFVLGLSLFLAVAGTLAILSSGTGYLYKPMPVIHMRVVEEIPSDEAELLQYVSTQRKLQNKYLSSIDKLSPKETYIVVDSTQNWIYLRRGEERLFEARCSAGSQAVLRGAKKEWVFDTPRGAFTIKKRVENPIWSKPVWAFAEEGKLIPANPEERIEEGTLGEYSMHLGDGYMIHGTLYERLIGRSVTHGCVRVGKEALRKIWAETKLGTPVFIY